MTIEDLWMLHQLVNHACSGKIKLLILQLILTLDYQRIIVEILMEMLNRGAMLMEG